VDIVDAIIGFDNGGAERFNIVDVGYLFYLIVDFDMQSND
tara:strand:+ start:792 stop:911 length:120 start_codon:yes stop_codon:yes gene_type:complete